MREIKFQILWVREKSDFTKEICTHYTTLERLYDGSDKFPYGDVEVVAKRQFTGLTDKHGVEIYEGDIVGGVIYSDGTSGHVGYVKYDHHGYMIITDKKALTLDLEDRLTVLGNIHQHPELLEAE